MTLQIRLEEVADAEHVHHVVVEAFRSASHTSGTEQFIVRDLRSSGAMAVSLVALLDGKIVGHVAISPVTISDGSKGWYGLDPVAVVPREQGRRVGSRLIEEALRLIRELGASGCVVLGEPSYYGRFGFRTDASLVLEGVPPEYFQVLRSGGDRALGTVTYHSAFAASR